MKTEKMKKAVWAVMVILVLCGVAAGVDPNDPNDPNDSNVPIAHWKFDEGAGGIAYDSAGDNDGTLVNGPIWTTGVLDGALSFDGVDDHVNVGDQDSLDFGASDSFSVGAWIKTSKDTQNTPPMPIVDKKRWQSAPVYGYYKEGYSIIVHQNKVAFGIEDIDDNSCGIYSNTLINDDKWHYVSVVRDTFSDKLYLYIDGIPDADPVADTTMNSLANDWDCGIGKRESAEPSADYHYFDGLIDDVRIYDRALSAEEIEQLYEEGLPEPSGVFYVDGVNGSDLNDGLSLGTAFATIQKGVEEANDADTVLVYPAVYTEAVNFDGKAITVQGVATEAGAPIVETPMDYAFSFYTEEEANSVLKNFVIRDSYLAAFLIDAAPTISNLTIVDNRFGIEAYAGSQPDISNCIFYNNTNGDLSGCEARYSWAGEDVNEPNEPNIPMFVDANGGDYRLKSERGRYWPEHDVWVLDDVTSPCVDGGDPNDNPADERMPNGGRINMGAYGGTAYASMSEWLMTGDVSKDGIVNFKDIAIVASQWLDFMPWAWNEPPEVVITSPDGSETVPYNTIDPVVIEADASDSDGSVVKVEFFADAIKVAEDNNGANGWQGAWHPVSDGPFTLTASATDDDGATATSPAVQVEVGYVW